VTITHLSPFLSIKAKQRDDGKFSATKVATTSRVTVSIYPTKACQLFQLIFVPLMNILHIVIYAARIIGKFSKNSFTA